LAFHSGQDPGVACLAFAARALWILGYPDQALRRGQEALHCARNLAHPFSEAFALTFMGYIHLRRREWQTAQTHAESVIALATAHGFPFWRGLGTIQHGWALAAQGLLEAGLSEIHQGVSIWQATGAGLGKPCFLGLLAEVHGRLGQVAEGMSLVNEALAVAETTGERWCESDLCRLKGDLLLARSPADRTAAEGCLQQALAPDLGSYAPR
jgi:predicted ATPase